MTPNGAAMNSFLNRKLDGTGLTHVGSKPRPLSASSLTSKRSCAPCFPRSIARTPAPRPNKLSCQNCRAQEEVLQNKRPALLGRRLRGLSPRTVLIVSDLGTLTRRKRWGGERLEVRPAYAAVIPTLCGHDCALRSRLTCSCANSTDRTRLLGDGLRIYDRPIDNSRSACPVQPRPSCGRPRS